MKTFTFAAVLSFGFLPMILAQDATETVPVAPTESYGCELHDDHYHCEGHVSETAAILDTTVTTPGVTPTPGSDDDHDHDHDHDHEGDDHDHDEDDHDAGATESLPPSPTASVGCEPHGDHWHCDGPASATGDASEPDNTDDGVAAQMIPVFGAVAAAMLAL